jgi:hypothetical protein
MTVAAAHSPPPEHGEILIIGTRAPLRGHTWLQSPRDPPDLSFGRDAGVVHHAWPHVPHRLGLAPVRGENALVRVVVTRIEQDGTMQRRVVDTAQCDDCLQWGRLAARALEFPPPYRPVPGVPVYHVSVGDQVILVAEHDLGGPLLNLVTAVLALGELL